MKGWELNCTGVRIYIYIDKGQLPKGATYRLFLGLFDLVYIVCVYVKVVTKLIFLFLWFTLERVDHISDASTVYSSVRNNDKINGIFLPLSLLAVLSE